MKRDLDLIRELLIYFEANCNMQGVINSTVIEIEGSNKEEIVYHIGLLVEAGYINAMKMKYADGTANLTWRVIGLTWQGHEFLDAARDTKRWAKTKNILKESGAFGIEAVKIVLSLLIKQALESQLR